MFWKICITIWVLKFQRSLSFLHLAFFLVFSFDGLVINISGNLIDFPISWFWELTFHHSSITVRTFIEIMQIFRNSGLPVPDYSLLPSLPFHPVIRRVQLPAPMITKELLSLLSRCDLLLVWFLLSSLFSLHISCGSSRWSREAWCGQLYAQFPTSTWSPHGEDTCLSLIWSRFMSWCFFFSWMAFVLSSYHADFRCWLLLDAIHPVSTLLTTRSMWWELFWQCRYFFHTELLVDFLCELVCLIILLSVFQVGLQKFRYHSLVSNLWELLSTCPLLVSLDYCRYLSISLRFVALAPRYLAQLTPTNLFKIVAALQYLRPRVTRQQFMTLFVGGLSVTAALGTVVYFALVAFGEFVWVYFF